MKVSVKDSKNCEKVLKIEIPEERIEQEYNSIFRSLAPKAKIPGFRPGKAPKDVIAMHYRAEAREEVLNNLLNEGYREAIKGHSLEPLGYPEIKDVRFDDKSLSFQASVEVRPKIKLSKVKGLSVKREPVTVKPEEIEEQLKLIQQSAAQFKAVEDRSAAMGDYLIADYVCYVDGKETEKRSEDWIELKEDEFLKGFSQQLVGVNPGEEKEAKVKFPEAAAQKELAGKETVFKVTVKEIKTKLLPEINDDLAKEAGDCSSLDELRRKIEKDLKAKKEREAEASYEKALLDELMKKNKIDLPPRMVQKRIDYMIEQAKNSVLRQGTSEEDFEKQKEALRKEFQPEAERQVHLAFLLDEIAKAESISLNEEDVEGKIKSLAERFKQPPDVIKKYYSENPDALEGLGDQIRNEKTIEFIKQNAKAS